MIAKHELYQRGGLCYATVKNKYGKAAAELLATGARVCNQKQFNLLVHIIARFWET